MGKERVFAQVAKHKMLAAAHNGDGELVRLGGGKDKDHAFRRFFQRFQQRVEGVAGEHMGFVNDENLVAAFHRRVADGFAQGAGVFHTVVGSAVDFGHVNVNALGYLAALLALVAGFRPRSVLAVERLGKNTGNGGFAHAASAAQKVGGCGPVFCRSAGKDGLDHVLSCYLGEVLRPVSCGEGKMFHGARCL